MRQFSVCAAGVLVAAVIGCGPAKELPGTVPERKVETGPGPDPFGPAPAASDQAAKVILERAVKAITENVPGGVAKAKAASATFAGRLMRPENREMADAVRTVEISWPDRERVTDTYKGGTYPTLVAHLRRGRARVLLELVEHLEGDFAAPGSSGHGV